MAWLNDWDSDTLLTPEMVQQGTIKPAAYEHAMWLWALAFRVSAYGWSPTIALPAKLCDPADVLMQESMMNAGIYPY